MNAERQRMNDEMAAITLQRADLEKEREEFVEDRKKHNEEMNELQMKINSLNKVKYQNNTE